MDMNEVRVFLKNEGFNYKKIKHSIADKRVIVYVDFISYMLRFLKILSTEYKLRKVKKVNNVIFKFI